MHTSRSVTIRQTIPGSHAVYVKEISSNAETIKVYKTTYDNKGGIAHTKDKLKKNGGKI